MPADVTTGKILEFSHETNATKNSRDKTWAAHRERDSFNPAPHLLPWIMTPT